MRYLMYYFYFQNSMFIKFKKIFYLPIKWMIKEKINESKLITQPISYILNEYKTAKEDLLEGERLKDTIKIETSKAKINFIKWLLIKK